MSSTAKEIRAGYQAVQGVRGFAAEGPGATTFVSVRSCEALAADCLTDAATIVLASAERGRALYKPN